MTEPNGRHRSEPSGEPGSPGGSDAPAVVVSSVIHHDEHTRAYPGTTVVLSAGDPARTIRAHAAQQRAAAEQAARSRTRRRPRPGPTVAVAQTTGAAPDRPRDRTHDRIHDRPLPPLVPFRSEPASPPPVAVPVQQPRSRRTRTRTRTAPNRRRLAAATALAGLLLAVVIPLLVQALRSGDDDPQNSPAGPVVSVAPDRTSAANRTAPADPRRESIAWLQNAIDRSAVVASDRASVRALRAAGFTSAVRFTDAKRADVDYVLAVAGTGTGKAATLLIERSVPLAAFGSTTEPTTVRESASGSAAHVRKRAREAADLRREGGRELARNPDLDLDAATTELLRTGRVDVRVQNLLSDLATSGTVRARVSGPATAEARADRPARTVEITTDDARAVMNAVGSLLAPYRPDDVTRLTPRTVRVSWRPSVSPIEVVGG